MRVLLAVLAASPSGDQVNIGLLAQYGVLGVFAAMLVVFARVSYKRETDRSDRLENEVQRLNSLIQEKVIPALSSATRAVEESQDLLSAMTRERVELHSDYRRRPRRNDEETAG